MCIDSNNLTSNCNLGGITCDDFSYASGMACVQCSTTFSNCVKCTGSGCDICNYGYIAISGACVSCPVGCKVCNNALECLLCNDASTKGLSCQVPKQPCNATSYYEASECKLCAYVNKYWAKCTSSTVVTLVYRNCMNMT